MKRPGHTAAAAIALLATAPALSGCAVAAPGQASVSQGLGSAPATTTPATTAPATTASSATQPAAPGSMRPAANSALSTQATESVEGAGKSSAALSPDADQVSAQQQVACESGEVVLDTVGASVTVSRDCAVVKAVSAGITVRARTVGRLVVSGDGVTVIAGRIGSVELTGVGSVVIYEGEAPKATITGVGSVMMSADGSSVAATSK